MGAKSLFVCKRSEHVASERAKVLIAGFQSDHGVAHAHAMYTALDSVNHFRGTPAQDKRLTAQHPDAAPSVSVGSF